MFFYLDATPSHSFLRTLYKYPQAAFPYASLVEENSQRLRRDPSFGLLETGVFDQNRYWDVEIIYAKETTETIFARILINNRGPDAKTLHVLPTLWFRNTWSWNDSPDNEKPNLRLIQPGKNAHWAVEAQHPTLGKAFLYGRQQAKPLFTENESNLERLFGAANASPYVKDGFHRRLIDSDHDAVNPAHTGTKFAAWHAITCASGAEAII